jgi:hypothetical protein
MKPQHSFADDLLPGLFQGADILPSQYRDLVRKSTPYEGERNLLFAVLEDGIRRYLECHDGDRTSPEFIETSEWINSAEGFGPFAFVNVCETLGIDPDRLRKGLNRFLVNDGTGSRQAFPSRRRVHAGSGRSGTIRISPREKVRA